MSILYSGLQDGNFFLFLKSNGFISRQPWSRSQRIMNGAIWFSSSPQNALSRASTVAFSLSLKKQVFSSDYSPAQQSRLDNYFRTFQPKSRLRCAILIRNRRILRSGRSDGPLALPIVFSEEIKQRKSNILIARASPSLL